MWQSFNVSLFFSHLITVYALRNDSIYGSDDLVENRKINFIFKLGKVAPHAGKMVRTYHSLSPPMLFKI